MNIICPECGRTGSINDALVPEGGKAVTCPKCRSKFTVAKASSKVGPVAISPPVSGEGKIRVTCPDCGAAGSLPAARIRAGGTTITCPKCKARFPVTGRASSPPDTPAAAPAVPGGDVTFTCPQCGRGGSVPGPRIPEGGMGMNCPGCNARFFVRRPGEVKPDTPQAAPLRPSTGRDAANSAPARTGLIAASAGDAAPLSPSVPSYLARTAAAPAIPKAGVSGGTVALDDIWSSPSIGRAVTGGAGAAFVGAILWAFITVMTSYQIGWMAVGVGALVGFAVKFFGRGTDQTFGFIGGGLALFGCVIGNLMAACAFISTDPRNAGFMAVFLDALGSPSTAARIMGAAFHPLDILFYILAVTTGYKVALKTQ